MSQTRLFDGLFLVAPAVPIDWEAVYAAELPRVLGFFRYRVGDLATAEDLTSTTFEKAWRARRTYRSDRASAGTWLLSIARNVAIDHFRSRRVGIPLSDVSELPSGSSVEEEAQRRADGHRLATLLGTLPDRERELLALKYGAGESNRDIARLTGLSESNVGTILSRVIATLRQRWEDGGRR